MTGIKYDGHKPEMHLLPPLATLEVGKVLTYGAKKYSPDNWRKLDNLQERYSSAAIRHLLAHMSGEVNDDETGMSHLAHALCCIMFKLEDELLENAEEEGARELDPGEYPPGYITTDPNWNRKTYYKKRSVRNFKHCVQYDPASEDN